jgi:hypothetical protein
VRLKNQDEGALQDHVFSTYITLRYGLAVLGVALPGLLWAVGLVGYGIDLQPSLSHYYFAPYPDNPDETTFPVRAWFVGLLFAIGTGLLLYRGFTNWENVSLNLAGGCAVLVALVPMNIEGKAADGLSLHGTFAILLFLALAFVSIFCAQATLAYLPDDPDLRAKFRRRYRLIGVAMLVSPLVALALTLVTNSRSRLIFLAEAFGTWSFAAYWWVKSQEMELSRAERRALQGKIPPPQKKPGTVLPEFSVESAGGQAEPLSLPLSYSEPSQTP